MNNIIYEAILKRHNGSDRPDVCIFYDEDKELVIREIADYDRKNGFTITEKDGRFSIADITSYHSGEEQGDDNCKEWCDQQCLGEDWFAGHYYWETEYKKKYLHMEFNI